MIKHKAGSIGTAVVAAGLLAACSSDPSPEAVPLTTPEADVVALSETPGASAASPPGPFAAPSFDCAKAKGEVRALVCTDQRLAELDKELDRLFVLAQSDPTLAEPARSELGQTQAAWTTARDQCAQADDVRACVLAESVRRIAYLRETHALARSADGAGLSRGPSSWTCAGADSPLSSVYVNGEPASMAVAWNGATVTLEAQPDPDGVRYNGTGPDGDYTFLVRGTAAMFARPGQPALSCEVQPAG